MLWTLLLLLTAPPEWPVGPEVCPPLEFRQLMSVGVGTSTTPNAEYVIASSVLRGDGRGLGGELCPNEVHIATSRGTNHTSYDHDPISWSTCDGASFGAERRLVGTRSSDRGTTLSRLPDGCILRGWNVDPPTCGTPGTERLSCIPHCRSGSYRCRLVITSRSCDDAETWSPPTNGPDVASKQTGIGGGRVLCVDGVCYWPLYGARRGYSYAAFLAKSYDGGLSWPSSVGTWPPIHAPLLAYDGIRNFEEPFVGVVVDFTGLETYGATIREDSTRMCYWKRTEDIEAWDSANTPPVISLAPDVYSGGFPCRRRAPFLQLWPGGPIVSASGEDITPSDFHTRGWLWVSYDLGETWMRGPRFDVPELGEVNDTSLMQTSPACVEITWTQEEANSQAASRLYRGEFCLSAFS